jgi:hypothetical protein
MKMRLATPLASSATAILLLAACGDDGPTTLAKGEGVDFVGDIGMAGHTLDINVEEEDGEVTGEFRFSDPSGVIVITVECADTADGLLLLAGTDEVNTDAPGRVALLIREGEPDRANVWFPEGEVPDGSCGEFLESIPEDSLVDSDFADVEDGDDIETS